MLLFILCKSGPELNAKVTTKTKFEIRPVQPRSVIVKEQDVGMDEDVLYRPDAPSRSWSLR